MLSVSAPCVYLQALLKWKNQKGAGLKQRIDNSVDAIMASPDGISRSPAEEEEGSVHYRNRKRRFEEGR